MKKELIGFVSVYMGENIGWRTYSKYLGVFEEYDLYRIENAKDTYKDQCYHNFRQYNEYALKIRFQFSKIEDLMSDEKIDQLTYLIEKIVDKKLKELTFKTNIGDENE